ncbi:hypothetical protein Poly51_12060 [Rubripirellula tenax]|uniref:General secretion pathway protein M n=1 Tax=Rubripirellula tenax TaxID=2528015 RepID=A0A5C6FAL7_9BACT|nr:hypothetical protein [Rubripirellula tenax]TWU58428.1 hypothetical protein Poly51_12060 [Rubripirellula tenax]
MTNPFHDESARRRWLFGIVVGILGIYSMLAVLDAGAAGDRLRGAQADLDEMTTKIAQIDRLKDAPRVAALSLESPSEITNRISDAREAAGLPQSSLMREQPTDPQRIGRSDFELRVTTIQLAPSTLPQILKFCEALRDEQTGTLVRDLRLSLPQNSASRGNQEVWEAEMALTQMIFSPKAN